MQPSQDLCHFAVSKLGVGRGLLELELRVDRGLHRPDTIYAQKFSTTRVLYVIPAARVQSKWQEFAVFLMLNLGIEG